MSESQPKTRRVPNSASGRRRQSAPSDINFQFPASGVEPVPLTNFRDVDIYNFAFSPDGARLDVARGFEVRDVMLIKTFR
jgi:hypothetical protein